MRHSSDERRQQDEPRQPNSDALDNFLDGLEEKMGLSFGVISSHTERENAKLEIAREMGLEDKYKRGLEEEWDACLAVDSRYNELVQAGEIQEDPDWDDPMEEFNEQINYFLEGGEDSQFFDVDNTV